jgi:hypothetical protein
MKKALPIAIAAGVAGALFLSADWSSSSGNAQRDGWSRSEDQLSRESAAHGDIKLLYSYKVDPKAQRMGTPVMLTNIISWKGFKSLAFVAGASDVYSIDYSTGKPYFKTQLSSGAAAAGTALCPGGITSGVTMSGGSTSVARAPAPLPPPGAARGAAGRAGAGGGRGASGRGGGGGGRGGGPGGPHVWVVGPDGSLQTLRQQDGDNKSTAAIPFAPANSRVSDLMMDGGVIYAATQNECGGPNALYAVDIASADKKVMSFPTNGSGFAGSAGVAASTDGNTVYGLIPNGQGSVAGKYGNTVVALGSKDLAVKDYFTPPGAAAAVKKGAEVPGATPAVFQWNGTDVVVAGGTNGRIYLLDAASLGGSDHHTPLAESEVFAAADAANGIVNAFATWDDPAGNMRWIYASISGASPLKFPAANGAATNGSIVAFKVEDNGGKPKLTPAWMSRDMISPAAPAVTNGLVFALSTGQGKAPKNAVLYALDSSTGKDIWSSGQTATSYATGGLAVNASMVLFATHDSQIHAYGIPIIF